MYLLVLQNAPIAQSQWPLHVVPQVFISSGFLSRRLSHYSQSLNACVASLCGPVGARGLCRVP